jgi:hypothetical protein
MPKPKKPTGYFAAVSRNICNRPFARDARLKAPWRQSAKTGRWLCDLPGDDTVQLRLPSDTPSKARRLATAFDVNVLFFLLSEAKRRDTSKLDLPSYATALKALDYTADPKNRKKLRDALILWSNLAIRFQQWRIPRRYSYVDKEGVRFSEYRKGTRKRDAGEPKYVSLELPPPVAHLTLHKVGFAISIAREWREQAERYFAMLPLPLPRDAAAQNLVVALRTSQFETQRYDVDGEEPFIAKASPPRRIRKLCRKLGLDHRNRSARLERAITGAENWFSDHGGELFSLPHPERRIIVFVLRKDVRIERFKRKRRSKATPLSTKIHARVTGKRKSAWMTNDDKNAALVDG